LSNTKSPSTTKNGFDDEIETDFNPTKAPSRTSHFSGMSIDFKLDHENACGQISFKHEFLSKRNSVRDSHSEKQESPIIPTFNGIRTDFNPERWKAPL
jgi:hypothetical protein